MKRCDFEITTNPEHRHRVRVNTDGVFCCCQCEAAASVRLCSCLHDGSATKDPRTCLCRGSADPARAETGHLEVKGRQLQGLRRQCRSPAAGIPAAQSSSPAVPHPAAARWQCWGTRLAKGGLSTCRMGDAARARPCEPRLENETAICHLLLGHLANSSADMLKVQRLKTSSLKQQRIILRRIRKHASFKYGLSKTCSFGSKLPPQMCDAAVFSSPVLCRLHLRWRLRLAAPGAPRQPQGSCRYRRHQRLSHALERK